MFSNLLFLIIILLIVNIALETDIHPLVGSPLTSFSLGMLGYFILLIFIFLQIKFFQRTFRHRNSLLFLINLELVAFLAYFHFVLGAHVLIELFPLFHGSQMLLSLFSLALYFGALGVYHYSYARSTKNIISTYPLTYAWMQLRLLLPFAIPFLLFTAFLDLIKTLPFETVQDFLLNQETPLGSFVLFVVSLLFMILMMIFLPVIIQWVWGCEDLKDMALKDRLEAVCQKAHFKHAGFKIWTVMGDTLTAAIVGIVPRFRYIIFTKKLLERLSPEALGAILAHEIGHSYRKHLLIYPLIIFGMIVVCGLFTLFFSEGLTEYLEQSNALHPSKMWEILNILLVFIPYAVIIALYFRYVFGYFSRIFERQADLHGFVLNIPPEHMVEALDDIAVATGHTHKQPSWHHYSIQERIDFLDQAKKHPYMIAQHHHKAKISLIAYLAVLCVGFGFLISPLMPEVVPFKQITELTNTISHQFKNWLLGHLLQ